MAEKHKAMPISGETVNLGDTYEVTLYISIVNDGGNTSISFPIPSSEYKYVSIQRSGGTNRPTITCATDVSSLLTIQGFQDGGIKYAEIPEGSTVMKISLSDISYDNGSYAKLILYKQNPQT